MPCIAQPALGHPTMTTNRTRRHRSFSTLVAAGAVLALHGCGGSDEPGRKQLGGVPPQEVTCSGVDLTGLSSVVYATPGGDASASCGGIDNPCGSVQAAIDKCDASGCAVLAGTGDFPPAQVKLRFGVHVLGGCQLRPESDPRWRTVFNGPASGAAAVVADSIESAPPIFPPTRFEGVVVMAAAGGAPGAPSVAMLLTGTTGVTLLNSTLVSGPGATGATGFTAPPGINRDGKPGQGRMDNGIPGAAGGQSPYGGLPGGYGGRGGNRYDYTNANMHCPRIEAAGEVGGSTVAPFPFSFPGGPAGGAGLEGGICAFDPDAETGHTGGRGIGGFLAVAPAADSSPDLLGRIVGTTWVGLDGSTGEGRGSPGYGGPGGGGGGAGGRVGGVFGVSHWSGPGAGGGGGGAGGDPGGSGGQGGASIALLMVNSSIAGIPANHGLLIPGPGGTGGAGGTGSSGGAGGAGQAGWQRDLPDDPSGGKAGDGGPGGVGGHGGGGGGGTGGNGGPSIGIALLLGSPVPAIEYIYNPSPGQGGAPGSGAPGGFVPAGDPAGDPVVPGPDGKSGKPSVPRTYILPFP